MSRNRLVFDGLHELREQLRNLPAELTAEAGHIVEGSANGAAVDIKAEYQRHRLTGRLAGGVTVTHFQAGKFSAGAIVKSTDQKAWIFENGTQARHYITKKNGVRHETGAMPPGHVFISRVIEARRRMYQQLQALLVRHGLVVSGEA